MDSSSSHESGSSSNSESSTAAYGYRKIMWKIKNFDQFMIKSHMENAKRPKEIQDSKLDLENNGGTERTGSPPIIRKTLDIGFSSKVNFHVTLDIRGYGKNAYIFIERMRMFEWKYDKHGNWNEDDPELYGVKCLASDGDGEIVLTKFDDRYENTDVWGFTPKAYTDKADICIYFQLSYYYGNSERETCCTLIFKDLLGFYNDITLVCSDGISIQADRTVLARFSPVFKKMFDTEAGKKGKKNDIKIKDIDSETMQKIITFLYTGNIGTITNTQAFISAVEKFDLQDICFSKLKMTVSEHNAWAALLLANMYGQNQFFKKCVAILHDLNAEPKASKEYLELSDSLKAKFIQREKINLTVIDSTCKMANDNKDEAPAKRPHLDTKRKKT